MGNQLVIGRFMTPVHCQNVNEHVRIFDVNFGKNIEENFLESVQVIKLGSNLRPVVAITMTPLEG